MDQVTVKKRTLTDQHLEALARGRTESAVIRRYLTLLESRRPRRGKQLSIDELKDRVEMINVQLRDCDAADKLALIKKRKVIEAKIALLSTPDELVEAEEAFVEIASSYAERKGIDFDTFREAGVPSGVLKRAKVA